MSAASEERVIVYVGTHTNDPAEGIHLFHLDTDSGALSPAGKVADVGNPFFLTMDADARFLYAANAVEEVAGQAGGGVCAFAIGTTDGTLTPLNEHPARGETPCYVSVTRDRACALVANYSSGSLAVLPIRADGRLDPASCTIQHAGSSTDPSRQEGPHVHSIVLAPDDRFAFAADLGTDEVRIYALDAEAGQLTPNSAQPWVDIAAGSGPRHLVFHQDGRHAYLINELSNTLTVFDYQADTGSLAQTQTVSTLPAEYTDTSYCADIHIHPSGRFLYGTNRGHDSIAVFSVDAQSGQLSLVEIVASEGHFPWNLGMDPTGRLLLVANQGEGNVAVFRMDADSGRLDYTGHQAAVPKAVCVEIRTL